MSLRWISLVASLCVMCGSWASAQERPKRVVVGPASTPEAALEGMGEPVTAQGPASLYAVAFDLADAGLVRADVLSSSLHAPAVGAVAPGRALFVETVHVLVRAETEGLEDLGGGAIAVGPWGSGDAFTARRILTWLGLTPHDGTEWVYSAHAEAVEALLAGEVDAVVRTGVAPLPGWGSLSGVKLLGLSAEQCREIRVQDPNYRAVTLVEAYPWNPRPTRALSVPLVLVGRPGADAEGLDAAPSLAWQPSSDTSVPRAEPLPGLAVAPRDPEARLVLAVPDVAWAAELAAGLDVEQRTGSALERLAALASGDADAALVESSVLLQALHDPSTATLLARLRGLGTVRVEPWSLLGADDLYALAGATIDAPADLGLRLAAQQHLWREAGIDARDLVFGRDDAAARLTLGADADASAAGSLGWVVVGRFDLPADAVERLADALPEADADLDLPGLSSY